MTPTELIIHHSADEDTAGFDVVDIKRYHMTPAAQGGPKDGPYMDVAYHVLIDNVKGEPFAIFGRPWHWAGAHCPGHNTRALGICFVGNYSRTRMQDQMLLAGVNVVKTLLRLYGIPASAIHRHSEFNATECPGKLFPWEKFIKLCGGQA